MFLQFCLTRKALLCIVHVNINLTYTFLGDKVGMDIYMHWDCIIYMLWYNEKIICLRDKCRKNNCF